MGIKKHKGKSPPFVLFEKDILNNPAWRSLKPSSKVLYIHFRSRTCGSIFKDEVYAPLEKEFKLSYSILVKDSCLAKQTVRTSMVELENKGFIDLVKQGGLKSGGYGMNTYRLSNRFFKYGQPELFQSGVLKIEHGETSRGFAKVWKNRKQV